MAQTQAEFRGNIRTAMVTNSRYPIIAGEPMPSAMEDEMNDSMGRLADPIWDMVASWALGLEGGEFPDERVRADEDDTLPGFLDAKVDDITIKVNTVAHYLYIASIPVATDIAAGGVAIGAQPYLYMDGINLMVNADTTPILAGDADALPTSRAVKLYVDNAIQAISGGGGIGDMLKSTYDTDTNGIVDNSERLGNELPAYYLAWGNLTGTPTTIAGYGITNAYTMTEVDNFFESEVAGKKQILWENILNHDDVVEVSAVVNIGDLAIFTAVNRVSGTLIPTLTTVYFNDTNTYITEDGSGNLTFVDAVYGTATLALLAAGSSATVNSVSAGDGMDFTTITVEGPVTMGTPSQITPSSINEVTSTSHTHELWGVAKVFGYPADTYIARWKSDDQIEGTADLAYNGFELSIAGQVVSSTLAGTGDRLLYGTGVGEIKYGNLSGHITTQDDLTTHLHISAITYQTEVTSLTSTDEFLINDGGELGRMDVSVLQAYLQANMDIVTEVVAGDGMDFTTIIDTGTIILGIPTTLTSTTLNAITEGSHTHEITGFAEIKGAPMRGYITRWDGSYEVTGNSDLWYDGLQLQVLGELLTSTMAGIGDRMAYANADGILKSSTILTSEIQDLIDGGSGMVYPDAGIALSTGSAWDTSITDNSTNWNTAFGWGDHDGLYDTTGTAAAAISSHESTYNHTQYNTAYSHSQLTTGNPHQVDWSELQGTQPAPISHTLLSHTIAGETLGHVLAADSATTYSIRQLLGSEINNDLGWDAVTPAALTRSNDTNVTLTLGGTPTTALLQATSLTLGWTGTLADGRIASASTWNAKQTGHANLTSLAGLTYASLSFVKMSASGTFSLDTATYLTSQTSHADVVVDGDFTSQGLMRRGASAGVYTVITDSSTNWDAAYTHSGLTTGNPHAVAASDIITLGADTRIPYMNGTTDFQYSANLIFSGSILDVNSTIKANIFNEHTTDAGVTIESILHKDGWITLLVDDGIYFGGGTAYITEAGFNSIFLVANSTTVVVVNSAGTLQMGSGIPLVPWSDKASNIGATDAYFDNAYFDRVYIDQAGCYIDITGSGGTLDMTFTSTLAGTVSLNSLSGGTGYWSRSSTDISPTTSGDDILLAVSTERIKFGDGDTYIYEVIDDRIRFTIPGGGYDFDDDSIIPITAGADLGSTSFYYGTLYLDTTLVFNNILTTAGDYYLTYDSTSKQVRRGAATSDIRLKNYKEEITNATEKVVALSGFTYSLNERGQEETGLDNSIRAGVSAQDVWAVLPEAVRYLGQTEFLRVDYDGLIALLINAFKEQQIEIEGLKMQLQKFLNN